MTNHGPDKKAPCPKGLVARLKTLNYYTDPQSIGTYEYHYISILAKKARLVVTDGVKIMCDELQCHWVVDHLTSVMPGLRDMFYVVYVVKNPDGGFYFILDDGNHNIVHCKRHPFTDIKQHLKLFLSRGEYWVLMLPSEY